MDHGEIYASHAAQYDTLVQAEDCDAHLIPAIEAIQPLSGTAVLEVGVGTGRIARAIAQRVGRLVAVDRAAAMLELARQHLSRIEGAAPWELHLADARALPVDSGWADVAIAGWVFGHFREWMPERWEAEVGCALDEMRRALRPGGALIIIETLGTGSEVPAAPTAKLDEYFTWLTRVQGLQRHAIRTDYQFADVESAAAITGFFLVTSSPRGCAARLGHASPSAPACGRAGLQRLPRHGRHKRTQPISHMEDLIIGGAASCLERGGASRSWRRSGSREHAAPPAL